MTEELDPDILVALQRLSSSEAETRRAAAEFLSGTVVPLAVPPLITLLADENQAVRRAANWAIHEIGITTEAAYEAISALLGNLESDVKLSALDCLWGREKDESLMQHVLNHIIRLLADPDRGVRVEAGKILMRAGDGLFRKQFESRGGTSVLAHTMSKSPADLERAEAILVLAEYESTIMHWDLVDPSCSVRLAAAIVRTRIDRENNRIRNTTLMWKGSWGRSMASLLLAESRQGPTPLPVNNSRAGDVLFIDDLLVLLQDSTPDVRELAIAGLQQIGDTRAIAALERFLFDLDIGVRCQTLLALGTIDHLREETIRSIAIALHDPIVRIRRNASVALRLLGRQASVVLETVLTALNDQDLQVRQTLVEVVALIQPTSKTAAWCLLDALEGCDTFTIILIKMALIAILPTIVQSITPNSLEDFLYSLPDNAQVIRAEVSKLLQ